MDDELPVGALRPPVLPAVARVLQEFREMRQRGQAPPEAGVRPSLGSGYSSLWSMWSVMVVSATGRLVLTMKPSTSSSR